MGKSDVAWDCSGREKKRYEGYFPPGAGLLIRAFQLQVLGSVRNFGINRCAHTHPGLQGAPASLKSKPLWAPEASQAQSLIRTSEAFVGRMVCSWIEAMPDMTGTDDDDDGKTSHAAPPSNSDDGFNIPPAENARCRSSDARYVYPSARHCKRHLRYPPSSNRLRFRYRPPHYDSGTFSYSPNGNICLTSI